MLRHRTTRLLSYCLTACVVAAGLTPSATALEPEPQAYGAPGPVQPEAPVAPERPTLSEAAEATQTLAEATALFAPDADRPPADGLKAAATGRDATMVLRDLAAQADELPTARQRTTARRLLLRPSDGNAGAVGEPKYTTGAGSECSTSFCVHWVEDETTDSVQGAGDDGDLQTVPVQVTTTVRVLENVYAKEVVKLGYRAPVPDGSDGGDARTDVYLADLGEDGLFGYCVAEPVEESDSVAPGYCVLDNDYASAQYPINDPLSNLRVTAAHEVFHLIQFGYDYLEDAWFMEGTAAWMEDEVYDSVDDNLQYLAASPLTAPYVPLDYTRDDVDDRFDYPPYGNWIFWRYLSESAGAAAADDPTVVRKVWEAAAGEAAYSTKALSTVLAARGTSFASAFASFGTWMTDPARYFAEGAGYPSLIRSARKTFTTRSRSGSWSTETSHMSQDFIRFTPGASLTGAWRLRVGVDLQNKTRGAMARLLVHRRSGTTSAHAVPLSSTGSGAKVVGFRRSDVSSVELQLLNVSTRFDCWQLTWLSCQGFPRDDRMPVTFTAKVYR